MSDYQRNILSTGMIGNKVWFNPVTGKHHNYHKVELQCSFCKKDILKKRCHTKYKNNFCGMECLGKFKVGKKSPRNTRQKTNCNNCGVEVIRKACEIIRSKNFFCSGKCNGEWKSLNLTGPKVYNWLGGHEPYYGENWRRQRKLVWERDNYTCQRCYKTKAELGKNPDVHHKKPFRTFGVKNYILANRLNNLISYCNRCHKIVELLIK